MNDDLIVAAYVVIGETMAALGHRDHVLAQVSDAEVLTVAVVAAKYFANVTIQPARHRVDYGHEHDA